MAKIQIQNPGAQFLHERNTSLHKSDEVENVVGYLRQNGEKISESPSDKIASHLGFLASKDHVNDGILTGEPESIDRQIETNIIIDPSEIPESYFDLQRKIAWEEGYGAVEIDDNLRSEAAKVIAADQRYSLKTWADYIADNDIYPDWFKVYAFDGVSKLGKFDKQKRDFSIRNSGTITPYPEISRSALSQVYDWVNGVRVEGEEVEGPYGKPEDPDFDSDKDAEFQKALKTGRFDKLYVYALEYVKEGDITPEQRQELKGDWKLYPQDSDPYSLHYDLHGFGLDWCTSTGIKTAQQHLKGGDFYVYYTNDDEDIARIPRVAVRMENGKVREVRGIDAHQEMEPVMADIVSTKLAELPGGEQYVIKARDMKQITAIEKAISTDPNVKLSSADVRLLYEMDHDVLGFGHGGSDPRIDALRSQRGERDRTEIFRLMPEVIHEQLQTAFIAYMQVSEHLGSEIIMPRQLERIFAYKDREWQGGVYSYLVKELINNRSRHQLVVTPIIEATPEQIVSLAEEFGKKQTKATYIENSLYRPGLYSGKDLCAVGEQSGAIGNNSVKLSLIPSKFDKQLYPKSVSRQKKALELKQDDQPQLNFQVPSLIESVSYWYALRAGGNPMDDNTHDITSIQHFNLDPKSLYGRLCVPVSSVYNGRASLSSANINDSGRTRLSVG